MCGTPNRRAPSKGRDSQSLAVEGALGALADAGIGIEEVDGVAGQFAADMVLGARMGPCSRKLSTHGIPTVLEAASMIAFGECEVVVIGAGGAAMYTERSATAPGRGRPTSSSWASDCSPPRSSR